MSSKRGVRRKSCSNKTRYRTMEQATNASFRVLRKLDKKLRAYKCEFCGGYHIGHISLKIKQSIIDKKESVDQFKEVYNG